MVYARSSFSTLIDPLWGFPIRCTAFSGRELLIPIRDGNVFPLSARSIINNVPGGNCAEETIQPAEDVRMVLPMGKLNSVVSIFCWVFVPSNY